MRNIQSIEATDLVIVSLNEIITSKGKGGIWGFCKISKYWPGG